jgi:hypothetical protein
MPMAAWVGPHWHPMSFAAQPAALTAEMMQSVWMGVKTVSYDDSYWGLSGERRWLTAHLGWPSRF